MLLTFHHSKRVFQRGLLIFTLMLKCMSPAQAEKPLWTPEDTVTYPQVNIEDISSDGKYTLIKPYYNYIENNEEKYFTQCILVNNTNLTEIAIGEPNNICSSSQFIVNGKKFSYITFSETESPTLFVRDVNSGKTTRIQKFGNNFITYTFAPDGKSFLFIKDEGLKTSEKIIADEMQVPQYNLYLQKIDANFNPIGEPQLLTSPHMNLYNSYFPPSFVWSPNNQKIAFITSKAVWKNAPDTKVYVMDVTTGKIDKLADSSAYFTNLFFSSDSQKLVYFNGEKFGEQKIPLKPFKDVAPNVIEVFDLKTKDKTTLSATDVWSIIGWAKDNTALVINKQEKTKRKLFLLHLENKNLTPLETPDSSSIKKAVLSQNQEYIGFDGENLYHPSEIYVTNLTHLSPRKITSLNKGIDLSAIKTAVLQWKSFDGVEIEGILVYPQGYEKGQKAPLIVSIHGGPAGVESEMFIGSTWFGSYSPAVFASEGYATLVVNYRGSLGYGSKFHKLNYRDLGGGDYQDVISGVDYLINQGIVDPEQLFIRGHSYGGFMTAWAVGHTNRFKAACVGAGIIDWISDIATEDVPTSMESLFGGVYWDDYELWRNTSPLSYVSNVETPILILQGGKDKRVPITQSQQFYQALQAREVPSRLVYYFGQEHDFESSLAIIDAMKEKLAWFKEYGGKR